MYLNLMTPYINIRYKQLDNDVQSKYCTRWQELLVQIELYNHNMSMIEDAVSSSLTEQAWVGTAGMKSLSKTTRTSLTLNLRTTQFSLKLLSHPRKCLVHLSLKQTVRNPQDMQKTTKTDTYEDDKATGSFLHNSKWKT